MVVDSRAKLSQAVVQALADRPASARATVFGLIGDLGSGKTAFVQALARILGITGPVTSPTFVIQKIYPLERVNQRYPWRQLIHLDCYRLERSAELSALGWSDWVRDPANLILVEWAERVTTLLPRDSTLITFTVINPTTRKLTSHSVNEKN